MLDGARIVAGDTVLDVGAGDGLIGFGALDRVGPNGRVVMSDVSEDLLDHASTLAQELGVGDLVSFVQARAEALDGVDGASVDVVTTRSVLIYVADKRAAFAEFFRVLQPGGRLSIFEPINSYFPLSVDEFWGFDTRSVADLVQKVYDVEGWTADTDLDPMLNFSDKDLVAFAEGGGFRDVSLDLVVEVTPGSWAVDWDRWLNTSPNPAAHTVGEALDAALTADERRRFEDHIRPLVDAGNGVRRTASAYLRATK